MRDTHSYVPASKAARLTVVYSAGDSGLTRAPDSGSAFRWSRIQGGLDDRQKLRAHIYQALAD